jgi:hypothetical protein
MRAEVIPFSNPHLNLWALEILTEDHSFSIIHPQSLSQRLIVREKFIGIRAEER